ncbi:GntR family transcriptional regulator [Desulfoferula mesophila]|uniref:GntR family transcriptional regulator n=1 Tax=Desulfoferula mesophila TaxID=3058419 RepID=A0AAU9F483_9BACT|nr:GntR family transcriptional regulator [Desulfoferula mesophilus]
MYHSGKHKIADLYSRSPIPLYLQVANILRRRIFSGRWAPEAQLPSIETLAKEFNVARLTMRQAIEHLESEGLLWKKQGKGTFVSAIDTSHRWLNLQTRWSELVKMVKGTSLKILHEKEDVPLPDLGPLEGVPAGSYHFMQRLHLKDGKPYCLLEIYISKEIFDKAPDEFRSKNIVTVLDSMPRSIIASGRQVLTIGTADPYAASCLDIAVDSPVASLRRVVLDSKGSVVYLGDILYSGSHVRLDINLQI